LEGLLNGLRQWMTSHSYATIDDFRGLIQHDPELPAAFERVQYMKKSVGRYPGT
jgi:hypothetical protein